MSDAFNAVTRNIASLLSQTNGDKLRVPKFQRGFSWSKKEVEEFWRDIRRHRHNTKQPNGPEKYFLGPVVLMKTDTKHELQLLDGQQRMATATILFAVLRDISTSMGSLGFNDFAANLHRDVIEWDDNAGYALTLGEIDQTYFQETVQKREPIERAAKIKSHRNIREAKKILQAHVSKAIENMTAPDALAELKEIRLVVQRDFALACISVTSQADAFRIFETLNDRGLRLSVPDLLLNYLMQVAESEDDRNAIRKYWNQVITDIGKGDIEKFLRHMWISNYGDLKDVDLFTALRGRIESDKSTTSLDFASLCSRECEKYMELVNVDTAAIGMADRHVRNIVHRLKTKSALPLLLSCHIACPKEDLEEIARWLLVFIVRHSVVCGLDSADLESILFSLAKDVRVAADGKTTEIKKMIKSNLVKFSPDDKKVAADACNLSLSRDDAKYLLRQLANRMETDTNETGIDKATLEHIFPLKPNEDEWPKEMIEVADELEWHLGNLTMLGDRINTKLANSGWNKKRTGYASGSELKITNEIAAKFPEWNRASIEARAALLAPRIVEIWSFDNPSRV